MTARLSPYESGGRFRITSPVGRRSRADGTLAAHYGLDLVGLDTRRVAAVRGGRVVRSRVITDHTNRTWEWGNYVAVTDDTGQTIYYCHLDERYVAEGDTVTAGQVIGLEGNTGASQGRHLHLEVREGSRRCDMEQPDTDACSAAVLLGVPNRVGIPALTDTVPEEPGGADPGSEPADWSREAVSWAVSNRILQGDGAGHLCLRDGCTREMAVVFLYRLWKLAGGG